MVWKTALLTLESLETIMYGMSAGDIGDFPDENVTGLGSKLKEARLAAGLSTRDAVAKLGGEYPLSHATLGNYERGTTFPSIPTLDAIAKLYGRPLSWFLSTGQSLSGVHYRNVVSRVGVRERERFEAEIVKWVHAYVTLEARLKKQPGPALSVIPNATVDPVELSRDIRTQLCLGQNQPLPSVIEILERLGVYVLEFETDLPIDGLAARYGDKNVVVLTSNVSADRARMSAAHELGHILFADCGGAASGSANSEKEARTMDFASHLLMPSCVLLSAFEGRSMVRLVSFKERYGISLSAMVYRAERERIIPPPLAKKLWIEFSKRGWRRKEPGFVRPDRATRFEQLLDGSIVEGSLSWKEAVELTGVRVEELRSRLQSALGHTDVYPPRLDETDFLRLVK